MLNKGSIRKPGFVCLRLDLVLLDRFKYSVKNGWPVRCEVKMQQLLRMRMVIHTTSQRTPAQNPIRKDTNAFDCILDQTVCFQCKSNLPHACAFTLGPLAH